MGKKKGNKGPRKRLKDGQFVPTVLTSEQAADVLANYRAWTPDYGARAFARKYGVPESAVRRTIMNGEPAPPSAKPAPVVIVSTLKHARIIRDGVVVATMDPHTRKRTPVTPTRKT